LIFHIREVDRDVSFLRRFLTRKLMHEMDMIEIEPEGEDLVVSRVSDDDNWKQIKHTLLAYTGMGSTPVIRVIDSDHGGNRTLLLRHEYDGRELLLDYAERTLRYVQTLWGRRVVLQTVLDDKDVAFSWDGSDFHQS
jgi:stage V sporulation protein R